MKSLTYKKVSRGLKPLMRVIELKTKEYRKYQHRLAKFVMWWNDRCVSSNNGNLVGSVLRINRINAVCTYVAIDHTDFSCKVWLRPANSSCDLGNGAGASKKITF